ncbi:Leucine-rich repeat receptor-like protein kinase [Musa troglodytarum]|uniref:Leucine-rich repeat receptor-like protein kinase n=1 Tax=Musa troglodytarum TaxID=320322 RepID=A0A9E7I5A2_9LILI|nr:Leucine-rich repeat receptor-like protein kinase [Musa troglodytarum]
MDPSHVNFLDLDLSSVPTSLRFEYLCYRQSLPGRFPRYTERWRQCRLSSSSSASSVAVQNTNLRSFSDSTQNCYTLKPVRQGNKYMIRAGFMYGNYDGKKRIPQFDIYIGVNLWDSFEFTSASKVYGSETMIIASADFISVCLVGIGDGAPFISSLELRPLGGLYNVLNTSNFFLKPVRYDLGSLTDRSIRYPYDDYDRTWTPDNRLPSKSSLLSLNTSSNISSSQYDGFQVPIRVMRTFVAPSNGSNINISWDMTPDPTIQQHIVLHLAEIQLLRSNESRIFDIFLNDELWYEAFSPRYLQTDHIFTTEPINQRSNMIRISKAANSTLLPILNAIEVYQVKSFSENLANNNLSGEIPDALGELHFLQELIGGNSGLCYGSNSCQSQRKLSVTIIIVIVVIAAAFLLMVAACMWKMRRKQAGSLKPQREGHSRGHLKNKNELFELKSRQFTFEDLVVITKNFQHAIGKGGFGIVYLGELQDGTQVAVKVNSQSSSQGINEFQAEGELLTRIHHKNLVSLVGYCEDGNYLALVYEYMAQGSLEDHLRGKSSTTRILNWIQRLQIAIEAAQEIAMKCTLPTSIERPTMSEVVMQLKECLALELSSGTTQIHDTSEVRTNCDDSVKLSSSTTTTNRRQDDDSELSSAGITTSHHQNESAVSQTAALLHQGCDFSEKY